MIDLGSIYRNPTIPEDYYYVKIIHLATDEVPGCSKPRVLVRLKPWWEHGLKKDIALYAIIHPTEAARFHYGNFLNTFRREPNETVEELLYRWGCVQVHTARYGETAYSAVKWIYQLPSVKRHVGSIEQDELDRHVYRRPSMPENYPGL